MWWVDHNRVGTFIQTCLLFIWVDIESEFPVDGSKFYRLTALGLVGRYLHYILQTCRRLSVLFLLMVKNNETKLGSFKSEYLFKYVKEKMYLICRIGNYPISNAHGLPSDKLLYSFRRASKQDLADCSISFCLGVVIFFEPTSQHIAISPWQSNDEIIQLNYIQREFLFILY